MKEIIMAFIQYGADWVSAIVAVICAVGCFISFLGSRREKKMAKESEERAKEYAQNANQTYCTLQAYYEEALKQLQAAEARNEKEELKEKAKAFIYKQKFVGTESVAKELGLSKENTFDLLEEMAQVDGIITFSGRCNKERIDEIRWIRRSQKHS